MMAVEKEDLDDLVSLVKHVVESVGALSDADQPAEKIKGSCQALKTFHTTSSMLGLHELEQVGLELETYLGGLSASSGAALTAEASSFAFALDTLLDEMAGLSNGGKETAFDAARVLDILHAPASITQGEATGELTADDFPPAFEEPQPQSGLDGPDCSETSGATNAASQSLALTRIEQTVKNMGGLLSIGSDGSGESLQISLPLSPGSLEKLQAFLSPGDHKALFTEELSMKDAHLNGVLDTIKEFMSSLSAGDMDKSQEILKNLAEQQHQAGLYKEIGVLARELHNSLRGFMDTMDPTLKELVEDKIPDSGSRLEHILQLTEHAANTTLDHVEAMQLRNQDDQKKLLKVREIMEGIRAIGDPARARIAEVQEQVTFLKSSFDQTSEDLITVLTAQDYQDLTGQIILKIIQLLKDLELKLVGVIKTFGVRLDGRKHQPPSAIEELYGPAHQGVAEALHSQDDVDSLLAEFGF
jgi:chemotaxis protein CheZ